MELPYYLVVSEYSGSTDQETLWKVESRPQKTMLQAMDLRDCFIYSDNIHKRQPKIYHIIQQLIIPNEPTDEIRKENKDYWETLEF